MVPDFWTYMALLPAQGKAIVLLVNVDHAATKFAFDEIGAGAAALLLELTTARKSIRLHHLGTARSFADTRPAGAGIRRDAVAVEALAQHPRTRRSGRRMWLAWVAVPILPNLLIALTALISLAGGRAGFLFLFAPDFSWTFLIGGSFATLWSLLRTWLTARGLQQADQRTAWRRMVHR